MASRRLRIWWVLLVLTAGALVAVNVFHFPLGAERMRALTGGERILDMRAGYGPADVNRLLTVLGPEGRRVYLELLWTLDLGLPALFSSFLWVSASLGALRRWRWMALMGGAADYVENAAITTLLLAFPAQPWGLARLASAVTVSKFVLYLAGTGLALAGALAGRRTAAGRGPPVATPR